MEFAGFFVYLGVVVEIKRFHRLPDAGFEQLRQAFHDGRTFIISLEGRSDTPDFTCTSDGQQEGVLEELRSTLLLLADAVSYAWAMEAPVSLVVVDSTISIAYGGPRGSFKNGAFLGEATLRPAAAAPSSQDSNTPVGDSQPTTRPAKRHKTSSRFALEDCDQGLAPSDGHLTAEPEAALDNKTAIEAFRSDSIPVVPNHLGLFGFLGLAAIGVLLNIDSASLPYTYRKYDSSGIIAHPSDKLPGWRRAPARPGQAQP